MKNLLKTITLVMVLACCHFLFEPVVTWGFGWKTLPDYSKLEIDSFIEDSTFLDIIRKGQFELINAQEETQAPAISIAVGFQNKLVWAAARGFSDIDSKTLANTETTFRIGSVSKAVTSAGLGHLLQQNKIRLPI